MRHLAIATATVSHVGCRPAVARSRSGVPVFVAWSTAASALIWRTMMVAEKRFRRLNTPHLLPAVYAQNIQSGITIESGKKLAA